MNRTHDVDVLCVGAGPGCLSVVAALSDSGSVDVLARTLVVEAAPKVAWQSGMLLPSTTSQVSFLKDLATLRDPRSRFTFVNFLHEVGRLEEFLSLGTLYPPRAELSNYLAWVADNLEPARVRTGVRCERVLPLDGDGWQVHLDSGEVLTTRSLVVGTGRGPRVPEAFADLDPAWWTHSSTYAHRVDRVVARRGTGRVVVVGGGQSAVEIVQHLRGAAEGPAVTLVHRGPAIRTYTGGPFVAPHYSDRATLAFFGRGEEARAAQMQHLHVANYAGVTDDVLSGLAMALYEESLTGTRTTEIVADTVVRAVSAKDDRLVLDTVTTDGVPGQVEADHVVLATGYEDGPPALLRDMAQGQPLEVGRDYRVTGPPGWVAPLYLLGTNEATHGIGDSLLSGLGPRSQRVVTDLLARLC